MHHHFLSRKVLIFLLINGIMLISCQNTKSIMIPNNIKFPEECMQNIVKNYFPCGTLITFVNPNNVNDKFLSKLTADNCFTLILKTFETHQWLIATDVYIVIATDYLELANGINKLSRDVMWNPSANFILFVNYITHTDMGDVFDIFLKHKMYKIVLIKEEMNGTMLYRYLPFEDDNCGEDFDVDDIIHIGECIDADIVDIFPDTEITNMSNCRLRVVATEDVPNFIFDTNHYIKSGKFIQGLEQYVLEMFEEKENVFIDYVIAPDNLRFGVVLPNGTATGLLSLVQNNQADIAAGGFVLIKNRIDLFDFIWGYNFAAFGVFTPAYEKNAWEYIYKEFSPLTWILIFISYCTVTITSILFSKNAHDRTYLMLRIWGYLYGNTSLKFSRQKGMKIILMFWILFTFFITNFYNTALYSLITRYNQILRLITEEQLSNLPYEPCISETSRIYFQFAFNQTLPTSKNYPECLYSETSLGFIASRKDLYGIEMEYIYSLHEYKYIDDEGNNKLDTWRFSINNVMCLYVIRGFAFQEKIQRYARQMYETGLLANQLEKIRLGIGPVEIPYTKKFKKVSILDLRVHFAIVILGSLLATILFLLEIWYGKRKLRLTKELDRKKKIQTPKIRFTN